MSHADDVEAAIGQTLGLHDVRGGADGVGLGGLIAPRPRVAVTNQHDAEGRARLQAFADQLAVTIFEDAQRQQLAGKEHGVEWEERQRVHARIVHDLGDSATEG